jgi:hypothetical protein
MRLQQLRELRAHFHAIQLAPNPRVVSTIIRAAWHRSIVMDRTALAGKIQVPTVAVSDELEVAELALDAAFLHVLVRKRKP